MNPWVASLLCLLPIVGCASHSSSATSRRPNVVLIVADDMGFGDVGANDPRVTWTPRLDRLARQGARLTDFYVSQPVCSASRASILTGCYASRVGISGALAPSDEVGIADGEQTLAQVCRAQGYATAAFGKWHLGHHPRFLPLRHGFDRFLGIPYSNDMGPENAERPTAWPPLPLIENERIVELNPDQSRFTRMFTDGAVAFIEESARRKQPFFAYVAHPMPHVPLHASDRFRGSTGHGLYADVIAEIDWSVGAIEDALSRAGVSDETLLIFTSDNGPWLVFGDHAGSTAGLREGKGTTFEGGVRVPALFRWPGVIPAGHVSAEPAMTIDLLPTIAKLIGAPLPPLAIDGADIGPLLTDDGAASPHEALFFWYQRNDLEAVRSGRFKLHFAHGYRSMIGRAPGKGGRAGQYDWNRRTGTELYDLVDDPAEARNVAADHPDVVARLSRLADDMRRRLGDNLTRSVGTDSRPAGREP